MFLIRIACVLLALYWTTASMPAQRLEAVVQSGHPNTVEKMAFSGDGRMLASADRDGTLKLWDLATYMEIRMIRTGLSETPATPNALGFSSDDKSLLLLATDRSAHFYEVASGRKLGQFEKRGKLLNLSSAELNSEKMLAAQFTEKSEIQVVDLKMEGTFSFSVCLLIQGLVIPQLSKTLPSVQMEI